MRASGILRGPDKNAINRIDNKTEFVEKIRLALYASKIVSYAQVIRLYCLIARKFELC